MKVFEACCIIVKRRGLTLLLYFVLFIALAVIITTVSAVPYSPDFTELRPKFTVINRDAESPLLDGLRAYLGGRGDEVPLEDDKEALQDATFYHATEFVIIIPPGFRDGFLGGQAVVAETVMTTESALGYYANSLMNQYLNLARLYLAADRGMDEKALADTVLGDLSARVEVVKRRFGESEPVHENYKVYARMMPYMLLVLIILCVSSIMMAFRRPDLNKRNLCAPVKPRSVGLQQGLCYELVGCAAWAAMNVTGFVLNGPRLSGTDGRIIALIVLDTFVFVIVASAIASFACSFVRGPNSQNAVANALSLVLSFIGGVFVPLEFFGDTLLAVARFTPTYWYTTALDRACKLTSFSREALAPVWQAMLIQLGFAAAIFCVALAVNKHRGEAERYFSSASTELEA